MERWREDEARGQRRRGPLLPPRVRTGHLPRPGHLPGADLMKHNWKRNSQEMEFYATSVSRPLVSSAPFSWPPPISRPFIRLNC